MMSKNDLVRDYGQKCPVCGGGLVRGQTYGDDVDYDGSLPPWHNDEVTSEYFCPECGSVVAYMFSLAQWHSSFPRFSEMSILVPFDDDFMIVDHKGGSKRLDGGGES